MRKVSAGVVISCLFGSIIVILSGFPLAGVYVAISCMLFVFGAAFGFNTGYITAYKELEQSKTQNKDTKPKQDRGNENKRVINRQPTPEEEAAFLGEVQIEQRPHPQQPHHRA